MCVQTARHEDKTLLNDVLERKGVQERRNNEDNWKEWLFEEGLV